MDPERSAHKRSQPCPLCHDGTVEYVYESGPRSRTDWGIPHVRFSVCPTCGFMCADPWPTAEAMAAYYASDSSASGTVFRQTHKGSRQDRITSRRVDLVHRGWTEYHGGSPTTHLDVGCGAGHLVSRMTDSGWRSKGLEPAEAAVKAATDAGLDVCLGTAESAEIPSGSFDLITCMSTLEHVWDVSASFRSIARWLAPGGLLVVEVPDASQPWPQLTEFYSFEHLSQFTQSSLAEWLTRSGLRVLETGRSTPSETSKRSTMHVRAVAKAGNFASDGVRDQRQTSERLVETVERYRVERESLIARVGARLGDRAREWRERNVRVGIYGGGWHTRYLLDAAPIADVVSCVIDSDPRKHGSRFLDWEIIGPEMIESAGLTSVVISSAVFEEEIAVTLAKCASPDIEVIRLYG